MKVALWHPIYGTQRHLPERNGRAHKFIELSMKRYNWDVLPGFQTWYCTKVGPPRQNSWQIILHIFVADAITIWQRVDIEIDWMSAHKFVDTIDYMQNLCTISKDAPIISGDTALKHEKVGDPACVGTKRSNCISKLIELLNNEILFILSSITTAIMLRCSMLHGIGI